MAGIVDGAKVSVIARRFVEGMDTPGGGVAEVVGAGVSIVTIEGAGEAVACCALPRNGTGVTVITGIAREVLVDAALLRVAVVQGAGVEVVAVERITGDTLAVCADIAW